MIVAGEASADLHGSDLVEALLAARPGVEIWGVGGEAMRQAGFEAVIPAEKISVAGLTEVLFSLPRIWRLLKRLVKMVPERKPNVIILIDLPDFNLRVAKKVAALEIPIVYYISPQVWAWRQKRVELIAKLVTQMLCILPFEQKFYSEHGVRAQFVGHPLVQQLPASPDREEAKTSLGITSAQGPVIALLPGSRAKEVSRLLPIMLAGVRLLKRRFPDVIPVIPVASTIERKSIDKLVRKSDLQVIILDGDAPTALAASDAAVVCSGTATLQAALLSRPMVVVYRVSWLTYQILKRMVKVAHISLVNLIVGRQLVPELIQSDAKPAKIEENLRRFLEDPLVRVRLNQEFGEMRRLLDKGDTATHVAKVVLNYLPEHRPTTQPVPGTLQTVRVIGGRDDDA